ncbi:hypothetical protein GCM10007989_00660 [Devosia pacifica]|uniref:Uncharacterized protein n=1 Tax=Devosia pacifica TaxID=1335967 RepID=A0A918RV17_9HYPH|nr:hypothetical protein [Devosia pacifica]GHA10387.1 hypothetical protein GCM10007989_00660 [Devosia pacifica]
MPILGSAFKRFGLGAAGAAILAIGLAGPVAAQPSFNFELTLPGDLRGAGPGVSVQSGRGGDWQADRGQSHRRDRSGYTMRCLTDWEIVDGVSRNGFYRVEIIREHRRDHVEVTGVQNGWLIGMTVDRCTGEVWDLQRLHRVERGGYRRRW